MQDLEYGQKTDRHEKLKRHTVGVKNGNNNNNKKQKTKNCKTWKIRMHTLGPEIWGETLKNVENEKFTLQDLEYGEKSEKRGK